MTKKIPSEIIDEIRAQVDITTIIGQYVELQKRGKNYFGFCPFHEERTPSFSVNGDKQFYHCFSCGRGGNVYNFLMELEGYSFPEAVQKVAELGHVATDFEFNDSYPHDQASRYQTDQQQIIAIHQELTTLYHYILMNTQAGRAALNYLLERGLSTETLALFAIGLAPEDSRFTYQHLLNKKFAAADIEASGVFSYHGDNVYDRFNSRIVFPLRNEFGDVAGFSGRILPGSKYAENHADAPKYLNSPETKVFNKSDFLFNLDIARQEVRKAKEIVLFEGFMDVIAAAEIGIKNGVASMGTSITSSQIQTLSRHTKSVLIVYDGDQPGIEATKRALDKFTAEAPKQKIAAVILPNSLDPDEYIQKYGREKFSEQLGESRLSVWRFYRYYYKQRYSLTTDQGKLQYIDAILNVIAQAGNEIEQEVYLQEVSEDTNVNVKTLGNQLAIEKQHRQNAAAQPEAAVTAKFADSDFEQRSEAKLPPKVTALQKSEMQLLNRLLYEPSSWFMLAERHQDFHFQTPLMETLFILLQAFRQQAAKEQPLAVDKFLQLLKGEDERRLLVQIMALELPSVITEREVDDLIYNIVAKSNLAAQMKQLNQEVELAKLSHDQVRLMDLNKQRMEIIRQMKKRK